MEPRKHSSTPTNLSMRRFSFMQYFAVALLLVLDTLNSISVAHAQTGTPLGGGSGSGTSLSGGSQSGTPLSGGNGGCGGSGTGLQNPLCNTSDIPTLLNNILDFIVKNIAPPVIILMLVYCGFLFVTAQGNSEKIQSARTALLWTVIGAIILLGAKAIAGVITTTVGTL